MTKQISKSATKSSSSKTTKASTKSTTAQKLNSSTPGRPKPMTTKAGYTQNRRRYGQGGNWCW